MAAAGVLSYSAHDSFGSYLSRNTHNRPRSPRIMSHNPSNSSSGMEEEKMSLPSISNLLGIADGSRPDPTQEREQNTVYYNSNSHAKRARYDPPPDPRAYDTSPISAYRTADSSGAPPSALPYARYSPLMGDAQASASGPGYAMEIDNDASIKRQSAHSQAPGYEGSYTKGHAASPSAASDGSVYSPTASMHRQAGSYGGLQPPYPQSAAMGSFSTPNLPASNPWEHHHYIGSSTQQGMYPPLPDRYICQTCNKAFSRPSSLKIHSHSHTGEKPFKCPHAGCSKAFSVKSNMKRHEKGCHTGGGQPIPGAYMSEDL